MRRPRSPADVSAWLVVVSVLAGVGIVAWPFLVAVVTVVVFSLCLGRISYPVLFPDHSEVAPVQRSVDQMIDSMHLVSLQAEKHWDQLPHPVRTSVVAMRRVLAKVDA